MKSRRYTAVFAPFVLLLLPFLAARAAGQTTDRPILRAAAVPKLELQLDGVLSEPIWAEADSITNLITIEPQEGAVPEGRTLIKVLASSTEIIIGLLCQDPDPAGIVSFSKARDSELDDEDHVRRGDDAAGNRASQRPCRSRCRVDADGRARRRAHALFAGPRGA